MAVMKQSVSEFRRIYDGDGIEYSYYLTIEEDEISSARYGAKITLKTEDGIYERESGAFFFSRERAVSFLMFLSRHRVTPGNLPYVIEDLLDFE